jgi:RNA polymerase sigma-70 factor (ECF subfamily)
MNEVGQSHTLDPSLVAASWLRAVAPAPRREQRPMNEPEVPDFGTLIQAVAREGDREAFGVLFDHFAPRVMQYLRRSGVLAERAEELAQEVLLTVWRKASYFDPARAGASTWIFVIARNLRLDDLRGERRLKPSPQDLIDLVPEQPQPDALLSVEQREAGLRRAILKLSDDQARVIRESYFQDKPHAAIASELGIPLGTVKSRLRLALGRLRELMKDNQP